MSLNVVTPSSTHSQSLSTVALGAVDGLFGGGSGTIFSVTCPEGETRLSECTISNQTTGCTHSQDGGAFCAGWF